MWNDRQIKGHPKIRKSCRRQCKIPLYDRDRHAHQEYYSISLVVNDRAYLSGRYLFFPFLSSLLTQPNPK